MREFQLWNAEDGLSALFDEIEQLALKCKFGNCNHMGEKGCAVIDAIIKGIITEEKLKNYRKLQKNLNILKKNRIKMLI
jgi:ribosome biogenesis GTPase